MTKRIVLCADDYGLSPGISRGIRELLERQRLSATSCMVVFPEFSQDGPLLRPFLDRADIGLHFTLTQNRSLLAVAAKAHLRPGSIDRMIAALEEQVGRFTDEIGRPPDYIDGHQHVHLLPVVREAVVRVATRIGAYVRNTCEPIDSAMWGRPAPLESAYLDRTSRPLLRFARQAGVATNCGFRGARSFRESKPFRTLFRSIVAGAREGSIVMCHPGHVDPVLAARDPIHQARADEWSYLSGPEFPADLSERGLVLCRLRDAIEQS
ncbi:MAG: ChbG/HpnK family deacetylase [Rhizomicrobium sp.]